MYVRTISRHNKDGSTTTYVQLAHNVRDPKSGYARANVLYSFGREDSLDVEAIRRLVRSLCRFISPEDAAEAEARLQSPALHFVKSVPLGGAYLMRKLWERLGLERVLARALSQREFLSPVEWAIFSMVANRALAPDSKRGAEEWVREDVALGNPEPILLQHLYRAMDFLLKHEEVIQKEVFFATADLFNLEVDLLFFDTTSTYMECEEEEGLRRYGHSKDKRADLPQVVIGLAVTKEGLPVRCWVLPGNTQDMTTVEKVKKDLAGWKLSRCIWVMDRGMNSEENRVILQQAGGHYILGEKLRDRQGVHKEVLSRRGRYRKVKENLEVKEVMVGQGERRRHFVLVYNPEQAKKDQDTREKTLAKIEEAFLALGDQKGKAHKKAVCALLAHRTLGRYVQQKKSGELKLNRAKVKAEEHLDGKYLLSTSDDSLSAEDVALGYKQLMEVERAFRTLKTTLELRPIYHRKDERIRAHVLLCFLSLLLVRIAERQTGQTWDQIRAVMERCHLGEFESKDGRIFQRTDLTSEQANIFKMLDISLPPKFYSVNLKA
ncbi:MAG: IS1634 family transposase [Candidatus Aminicenantaceae bacterium]|jgi:transposase